MLSIGKMQVGCHDGHNNLGSNKRANDRKMSLVLRDRSVPYLLFFMLVAVETMVRVWMTEMYGLVQESSLVSSSRAET